MAKKGRKTAPKRKTGRPAPKPSGRPAKVAKKASRPGGSHVSFGVHGMKEIMKKIKDAGLESELNQTLDADDLFVKVQRKSLTKIKDFINSKEELSNLSEETRRCDCPPDDPYCIYLG
ncbi:hypothetical protein [Bradyrhizobium sp. DASA03120]|uniref:hypothetical protein n=1 Tax=Bradyrhizobium sp. SMVTL-02 TaxID=3395917 RepID=UPI003F70B792